MIFNVNGIEFCLNEESNKNIPVYHWFTGVLSNGIWEKETFETFDKVANKESTVLDIGSWIGPTSIYLSKKFKKVISIEADRVAYDSLKKNIDDNYCKNIETLFNAVFTENGGHVYFGPNKNNSEGLGDSMSQIKNEKTNLEDYEVKTISLSEIVNRYPDDNISFVKVDIEGGEEYIIEDLFELGFEFGWKVLLSFHYDWWNQKNI
jgi:FkbM family methyltransferase